MILLCPNGHQIAFSLILTPLPVGSWDSAGSPEGTKCTPRRRRLGVLPASQGCPWHAPPPTCCYSDAKLAGTPRFPPAAARVLTASPSGGRQDRPRRLSSWPDPKSLISPIAGTRNHSGGGGENITSESHAGHPGQHLLRQEE